MEQSKLQKLALGANQFYLGKYLDQPLIDDIEWDQLKAEYMAEGGSVVDLVEWEPDMRRSNTPLPKVSKTQVTDNDLGSAMSKYVKELESKCGGPINYYCNYKYDGSSIIAYYTPEGKLQRILGTPDQDWCMDRTRNCWNMFPHQINPGIECIQGEFLVDAGKYGELARNKANGLLNSKDMIDELEREGFIRVYQMRFYDGNWSLKRLRQELNDLPCIDRYRERFPGKLELDCIFREAEELTECPTESIITEYNRYSGCPYTTPKFQVDGVVLYYANPESYPHPSQAGGYYAFKFYYTESAITEVTQIVWNLQDNGGYSCKIKFAPIKLNGKSISQASSGGVSNLMYMKMGKGAKVRVILSNMTIPKIIQTIEPSEDYQWPVCGCGYQLSPKDIYGSTLKCSSDFCDTKYKLWLPKIGAMLKDATIPSERVEVLHSNPLTFIERAINIDRWDAKKSCKTKDMDKLFNELVDVLCNKEAPEFIEFMNRNFYFSWLCQSLMKINAGTAFHVLRYYFKD